MFESEIVMGVIAGLSTFIGGLCMLKIAKNAVKNEILDMLDGLQTDENTQKALYTIGALIANGAKGGFGLGVKGGKMKWQDLVIGIAAQYLPQVIGKTLGAPAPAAGSPLEL